uniref:Neural proliferation differentiation and control protein 1 n=1 Tax=Globodera pallida TaxID=36090 RepID=A0A183CC72_GLOPA
MTSLSQRTGTTWAIAQFMCSVAVVSALLFGSGCSANHLFSEGGSFPVQDDDSPQVQDFTTFGQKVYTDDEFQRPNQQFVSTNKNNNKKFAILKRRRLSNIIAQLRENGQSSPQELADGPGVFVEEQDLGVPIERPPGMGTYWDELKEQSGGEQESSEMIGENDGREIAAVKKGQNEFVEFVEPQPHQNNRHKEWMDKRVPTNSDRKANAFKFLTNSGNLLFMAYLAVCCFGIVAGTVGGVYYYNHVRASRIDDPFNEFTRYSPAGPGKDKLKKSGSPVFGQSGDDTLAYKAQLHHYQQQKQILGSASGPVVENVSDNEEDTEEMDHNYSVFECPGLAPTGDLEIQNPNFVGADKSGTNETRRAE